MTEMKWTADTTLSAPLDDERLFDLRYLRTCI